ncbi:MAG: hypothetical protein LBD75_05520 [Candidatus Peribacteria bacterium]|jgi:hypothetical protein|nr:hypothetical protein [Candidatus Peribacteria bacterium]
MVEKYLGKEANEKTTIVNATKELLQKIDVAEAPDEHIGNFFDTLNTYEENDKLQLLHDVLKDGEIKIGS